MRRTLLSESDDFFVVEESESDKGKCSWLCISFAKQEIRIEL